MAGNKCDYYMCKKSKRDVPKVLMHRFPRATELERQNQWVINSGNLALLDLDEESLSKRFLCTDHFTNEAYMNEAKKSLKHDAVPVAYNCSTIGASSGACSTPQSLISNIVTSTPSTSKGASSTNCSPVHSVANNIVSTTPKVYRRADEISPKFHPYRRTDTTSESTLSEPELITTTPSISNTTLVSSIIDMPSPQSTSRVRRILLRERDATPRKKKLYSEIFLQRKLIASHKLQLRRHRAHMKKVAALRSKDKKCLHCKPLSITNYRFPSTPSKTICEMQLRDTQRKWSPAERKLALSIYYKSPSTYQFMLDQKIVLPAISTVKTWIGRSKFLPGFNKFFWENLKKKFDGEDDKTRSCVLMFDELSIKECLEYNPNFDFIEGFQDLGNLGRTKDFARSALVFIARGLYSPWKVPLAYFLSSNSIKNIEMKQLISSTIEHLQEAGINTEIMVCDQGPNNRSAMKYLGATVDRPFIRINEREIICIYDVPHLFKSIRNNLLNGDFIHGEKVITFSDVRLAYDIDKRNKLSSTLVKLTPSHLYPNSFEKQSVSKAVQVLSYSVASTIRTCYDTREITTSTALDTADFLERANNLFDTLNSKAKFDKNPHRCALTRTGTPMEILKNAIPYFQALKKRHHTLPEKKRKLSDRPPCFDGIIQSIKGILLLFERKEAEGYKFLLTGRLNQDPAENLFSIFRQSNGYNRNPTSRTLRTSFRSTSLHWLLQNFSKNSNCEEDGDDYVQLVTSESHGDKLDTKGNPVVKPLPVDECFKELDEEAVEENLFKENAHFSNSIQIDDRTSLENCSLVYFAGAVLRKCLTKYKCEKCQAALQISKKDLTVNHFHVTNKNYSDIINDDVGLKAPHEIFTKIFFIVLTIFEGIFEQVMERKGLLNIILNEVFENNSVSSWVNANKECEEHRVFALENIIKIKIFYRSKTLILKKRDEERKAQKNKNCKDEKSTSSIARTGKNVDKNSEHNNKLRIVKHK